MPDIVPVILAAGDSSRMGYPKALLPLGTGTFLTRILETLCALGLPEPRVVLGIHEAAIRPLLGAYRVRIILNPEPAGGQISSMKLAMRTLDPDCAGCLIWPVDQPLVSADLVHALTGLFLSSSTALALPRHDGKAGHPAIFGNALIKELLAAPADANPKLIVAPYRKGAAWLPTEEAGTVEDIDTPEDYLRHTGETLASALARRH
jgi:molybdenum cofactor cytidylyltransferase